MPFRLSLRLFVLPLTLAALVMGVAYFICGVIPALFIKDKQFDPQTE